ncbi:MAG: IcmS protein [marine bacterium B5-7]|nr:MAG: IcmS protein [marine bacterium B5-7]
MTTTEEITKKACVIARQLKANFTLHSRPIPYEDVFKDIGLLPAMARRADQLCSLCLGYGLGITLDEQAEGTQLGVKVVFDDITPETLRLLCLTDVMCELIHCAPSKDETPLDELLYD